MANSNAEHKIEWLLIEDLVCLKEYVAQWQKLVKQSQSNLFCSPEWIMTWIGIYWQPSWQLKTIVGFENNKLIAIAPLYIQKSNKFISTIKLLPLGQGEPEESEVLSEFQDIILAYKNEYIYVELANQIQAITFDQLCCNKLLPNSNWHQTLSNFKSTTFANTGKRYLITNHQNYLLTLSKNNKSKWKRCQNKFEKLNTKFIWVPETHYDEYWKKLISFHQKRWNNKGKLGAFSHPNFIKFHEIFQQYKNIKMSAILINQEPIAINYYLYDHDTLYFYQCGWDEKESTTLSPGFSLHIWSILNNPMLNYDFMTADTSNSYKSSFARSQPENIYQAILDKNIIKQHLNKIIKKTLQKLKKTKINQHSFHIDAFNWNSSNL
jgi:hypothetical protein